jgi:hypothetical protein
MGWFKMLIQNQTQAQTEPDTQRIWKVSSFVHHIRLQI